MFNYFSITVRPRIALDYTMEDGKVPLNAVIFMHEAFNKSIIRQNSEVNKEKPFTGFVPLTAQ